VSHLLTPEGVKGVRSVHFIGICGTAMASVAVALKAGGFDVRGSDRAAYPPMSTFLAERGIPVFEGYEAKRLEPAPDLVVVGNAVSRGNPEVEAVLDRDLPYCSLPELLERVFLPGRVPVVVTGTHGKTTTAALTTWILKSAGKEPSWLIGGVPPDLEGGCRIGEGQPFVLEGDEYDTAFFDKRSKFLHYRPRVVILNNLEYDHADIFPDLERIRDSFRHMLRIVPGTGLVAANADDPEIRALAALAPCPVETYSLTGREADWRGSAAPGFIDVEGPGGYRARLHHNLVGRHQGWNVLAAVAACRRFGVGPEEAARAVASFRGVKRRAEKVGEARGVAVYDDFAHHPTAIRGTLEGFRDRFPESRIWALLEPRSNTMRRNVFQAELAGVFDVADKVAIRAVPDPEKAPPGTLLDVEAVAGALRTGGREARAFPDAGAIVEWVAAGAEAGDVVVVLSNGGFEGIHGRLVAALGGAA